MSVKLRQVIEELVEEKGLSKDIISDVVCQGMLAAYLKKYPEININAEYNKKTDEIEIFIPKTVSANIEDDSLEISLKKARALKDSAILGDVVRVPFDLPIGRVEILKAKQVISQKIKSIEAAIVYKEFKSREGSIVRGTVHKIERNGITVKIMDHFAFLPQSLSIPDEKFTVGYAIVACLKEVLSEPREDSQLILERRSSDFIRRLFELEIPEVFERIVEIRKVVRAPGYKTKILVSSNDQNIDPVGTCIGIGGVRIKPILKEINGEKIDVIKFSSSLESLIKDSLKPAKVNRVEISDNNSADVWIDEDQRSVAIGKSGQNIILASKLTGVDINIVSQGTVMDNMED